MKASGPDQTIAAGDVIVTEERAKKLSQPRSDTIGKLIKDGSPAAQTNGTDQTPAANDTGQTPKNKVRSVGPTFYPIR